MLETFVKETGLQIVGVGSWVSGQNYKPGVSDHDLRLVLPPNTTPEQAKAIWLEARQKLKDLMVTAFNKMPNKTFKTSDILAKTNFYPPDQMMGGVPDMNKAWEVFQETKAFPNLAAQPDKATIEAAEGLYGTGSKYWRQKYEIEKGIWLYADEAGEVVTGSAKSVHIAEGIEKTSAKGMANTGKQWIEHGWDELRHGANGKTIGKYLERTSKDIWTSMELGGMPTKPLWIKDATAIGRHLQQHPDDFSRYEKQVRELLQQGYRESAIAAEYAVADPAKKKLLDMVRKSCASGGGGCMIDELIEISSKYGKKIPFAHAVQLAAVAIDMAQAGTARTETERAEAIYSALPWMVNLPTGLLSLAVDYGRGKSEELGVGLAAEFQDVWDMMEGAYSAAGRTGVGEFSWPLDRLLREVHTEDQLRAAVTKASAQASSRGFGQRTGELDRKLGDRLFEMAWPVVKLEWTNQRKLIATALDQAMANLGATPVKFTYAPKPAYIDRDRKAKAGSKKWLPIDVEVSLNDKEKRLEQALESIRTLMAFVGETGKGVAVASLIWEKDKSANAQNSKVFEFTEPGDYPVNAKLRLFSTPITYAEDTLFARSLDLPVSILVRVIPPEKDLTGTRIAYFEDIEAPQKVGNCTDFKTFRMSFLFPVAGGKITDLVYQFDYASCSTIDYSGTGKSSSSLSVAATNHGKLVDGYYEGGDGGKFKITLLETHQNLSGWGSGPPETEKISYEGNIWANGTATGLDLSSDDEKKVNFTFEPF